MDAAIEAFEQAVSLTPPDSPNLAPRRSNLALALSTRASRSADSKDLGRAQESVEAALAAELPPDYRASITRTLAAVLTQAAVRGPAERAPAILTRVIELLDAAVNVLDEESSERMPTIFARAGARLELYDRMHEPETLEQAIIELEELEPTPGSDAELQRLISLARALGDRHTLLGRAEDLDRAITLLERAVDAAAGSRLQPVLLEELGLARFRKGTALNRLSDLERALHGLAAALDETPPGSLRCSERLGRPLAVSAEPRSRSSGATPIRRRLDGLREAAENLPPTSRRRPLVLRALADGLEGESTEGQDEQPGCAKRRTASTRTTRRLRCPPGTFSFTATSRTAHVKIWTRRWPRLRPRLPSS